MNARYPVIIIGAGPAGLAAARALFDAGVKNVLLLEREAEAGGVPRHCRHPTFGIQTFYRPMNGDRWAARIRQRIEHHYEIRTNTTVVSLNPGGVLEISSDRGLETLYAERIIIATGVRETPRHARLVSGLRPQGVLTAGALQQFIYLRKLKPGNCPVIVGSELVSFSAIWTLRNAGIRAVALIDENLRPTAFKLSTLYARLMGVEVHLGAHITRINGTERVESIAFRDAAGQERVMACDSLIFTGRFTGEYTLIRTSHLLHEADSGRPIFDQYGCCSDPAYYAVGNMTHPADMGDQCYQEGLRIGRFVAESLRAEASTSFQVPVILHEVFKIAAPNVVRCDTGSQASLTLNVRVNRYHHGEIRVMDRQKILYRKRHRCLPERRILLRGIDISALTADSQLTITI
ncbi:Pyridine nucleotide-disulfide oxidoreductase [Paramixta manurensis]|uniref:Pyridine nucleotide-disulfide oxidoreductase n=1 Tax=Paramixta manurensis TaxID=2740817 RepID=A0A6M8UBP9_9GAMM|nr:Pyridine nucleotide-disulfide oxidoreductase [Erwiniaceae bacterium PD-1]